MMLARARRGDPVDGWPHLAGRRPRRACRCGTGIRRSPGQATVDVSANGELPATGVPVDRPTLRLPAGPGDADSHTGPDEQAVRRGDRDAGVPINVLVVVRRPRGMWRRVMLSLRSPVAPCTSIGPRAEASFTIYDAYAIVAGVAPCKTPARWTREVLGHESAWRRPCGPLSTTAGSLSGFNEPI